MMAPTLSPEQARSVAMGIMTYMDRHSLQIGSIDQYYTLYPAEVYNVHFTNGLTLLFIRDTDTGQLEPALSLTYYPPDYTNMQRLYLKEVQRNLAAFFADVACFVDPERAFHTRNMTERRTEQ